MHMTRTKKLVSIYTTTLLLGSVLAAPLVSDLQSFATTLGVEQIRMLVASLLGLLIAIIANARLTHLDEYNYFRMMMRVLLGILVATYISMLAMSYEQSADNVSQRIFFIYGAVAVGSAFFFLRPKKK